MGDSCVKSTAYSSGQAIHVRDLVFWVKGSRLHCYSITGNEPWLTTKGTSIYLTDKASHDRLNG